LRIGIPSHKLLISTQGAQIQRLPFVDPLQRNGHKIALIGKMDFFPNWHGAAWFARHVLPLLPEPMRLKVVGDCPPNIRARLEALPRVEVTGRVDSLADACADCVAAIAPMKVATGIQNKVLEYFAMGLPSVVSESVAAGLLPAADGACHVATTPTQWADALRRVATDPSAASAMARSARAYVQSCHSWDHIGSEYIERLQQLLHATPRPSAVPELT
jgi:glycosyltransferase involved in cell wall biosynthesis